MSYYERRSLLGIMSTIVISVVFYFTYIVKVITPFNSRPASVDYAAWGKGFLIFFGILIVARIVVIILQLIGENIVMAIMNPHEDPKVLSKRANMLIKEDERYKMIDRQSMMHASSVLSLGILSIMIVLTFGGSPIWIFYILYLSICATGIIVETLFMILHHRNS